jgi:hypothetical protein
MKPAPNGATRATIDYRMMRRDCLRRVRSGDVPLRDACDAPRDLLFAAVRFGMPRRSACPLCARHSLYNVVYLFGPRLPRSGRCVVEKAELRGYDARPEHYTSYEVEVCVACEWNHLLRARPHGGQVPVPAARRGKVRRRA